MITNTGQLQSYIDGNAFKGEAVTLAPGDYHIRGNEQYRPLHLCALDPYSIRVFVYDAPLLVGSNSYIHDLTFHAVGDIDLMRVDHSSRAKIFDNFFNAEQEHRGNAIVTTEDSISEDNWNVRVSGNEFRNFKAGIKIITPGVSPIGDIMRVKGTSKWQIANNGFDGCEIGLDLARPELFIIQANHFQLHEVGINIQHGHTNWLLFNDFERGNGKFDIQYDAETCNTLAFGNTPPDTRLSAHVQSAKLHNSYVRRVRKLNIWADCDKGA